MGCSVCFCFDVFPANILLMVFVIVLEAVVNCSQQKERVHGKIILLKQFHLFYFILDLRKIICSFPVLGMINAPFYEICFLLILTKSKVS